MLIKTPVITEKSIMLAETRNQYTFKVDAAANKQEAAKEMAAHYKVSVKQVKVHNRLGKQVFFGTKKRVPGKRADSKIMIFTLKDGDKIAAFNK